MKQTVFKWSLHALSTESQNSGNKYECSKNYFVPTVLNVKCECTQILKSCPKMHFNDVLKTNYLIHNLIHGDF